MTDDLEALDRRRMRYLEYFLIGFVPFLILSIARFFFRQSGLNHEPIGTAVLIGLILSVVVIALSTLGSASLAREIKDNPSIQEALNNELIQAIELRSWKAAYLGAIAVSVFFAVTHFFYLICDPVLTALTSIITGAGAYQAFFYFRYKAS
jgi:membrane protease YdiL (CAAX protease family)